MSSIDYGFGKTNIDIKTGIRYGVISANKVDFWADESEPCYPEPNENSSEEEIEQGIEEGDYSEPLSFYYDKAGYYAEQTYDDTDIFITKSPYYTFCGFCSPCAPGAGYLVSDGDVKAYCFGHNWFENGIAPYKVYSVKTHEEILPDNK